MGRLEIKKAVMLGLRNKPAQMREMLTRELHSRAAKRVMKEKKTVAKSLFKEE